MLHNTFPPRSNSAPKPLTATLMQEVITMHENSGVSSPNIWWGQKIWGEQNV